MPLLRTVQQAKDLVISAKFPPQGQRGFGSPFAPSRFDPAPTMTEYLQQANDSLLTMVQIETREALDVVEDIAAVPGIDVLFIGPFDLGTRAPCYDAACPCRRSNNALSGNNIGHPILNGVMDPELDAAIAKILAAARGAGKKCGIFCGDGVQSKMYADQGFDMISAGTDVITLAEAMGASISIAKGGRDTLAKSKGY